MADLLLIPGIGGHPHFHQALVDGLSRHHRVHTAPHGDFFSQPFAGLAPHTAYWGARLQAVETDTLTVVAVSFGAHIVPGLLQATGPAVRRIVLISPWLPRMPGRLALALAGAVPERIAAPWLARRLMRWSEDTGDAAAIAQMRTALYDDPGRVAVRWHRRLLAIRQGLDWTQLDRLARTLPVDLMFGQAEMLGRLQRAPADALAARHPHVRVRHVAGGHEIGQQWSPALAAAFDAILAGE
jgi:pimeloyl-ACP methyl ester carboxylesterase